MALFHYLKLLPKFFAIHIQYLKNIYIFTNLFIKPLLNEFTPIRIKAEKEINTNKIPIVRIDNKLESLINKPIFQQKLNKANETLRTVGLPKN